MALEWNDLIKLTNSQDIVIERVKIKNSGIAIDGEFELPPLATLTPDDQVFLAAFVRSHGSIKQMEKYFGVSYPTIKNRLNKLSQKFEFVEINPQPARSEILDRLERGEINVGEAIENLNKGGEDV